MDGSSAGGAGVGLGGAGRGAATRRGAAFLFGDGRFFLGAALRALAAFLWAGRCRAAAFRCDVFFRAGALREALRAITFFLPRLAVFFRFARFFAKLSPPFSVVQGLRTFRATKRTRL